jgi:hypothetical protein
MYEKGTTRPVETVLRSGVWGNQGNKEEIWRW